MATTPPTALELVKATAPRTERWWMTTTKPVSLTDDDTARIIERLKQERVEELRERELGQMRWARLHAVERGLALFIYFFPGCLIILTSFIPSMKTAAIAMFWSWIPLSVVLAMWVRWRTRDVDTTAYRRRRD